MEECQLTELNTTIPFNNTPGFQPKRLWCANATQAVDGATAPTSRARTLREHRKERVDNAPSIQMNTMMCTECFARRIASNIAGKISSPFCSTTGRLPCSTDAAVIADNDR